jgi:Tfp pilus assembly ATPase PilU
MNTCNPSHQFMLIQKINYAPPVLKTESNSGRQKHICLPLATVPSGFILQQLMQKGRQTPFRRERRCKYAIPLSSKANGKHTG